MMRVRLPRMNHAINEPIKALPSPIQTAEVPNLQPNCPAYPTKTTAEKYDVPKAKAESQGPTLRPANTKSFTLPALFRKYKPTKTVTAQNNRSIETLIIMIILLNLLFQDIHWFRYLPKSFHPV